MTDEDYYRYKTISSPKYRDLWKTHKNTLLEQGWSYVQLDYSSPWDELLELNMWVEQNIKGRWGCRLEAAEFIFEQPKDATWVRLNWGGK